MQAIVYSQVVNIQYIPCSVQFSVQCAVYIGLELLLFLIAQMSSPTGYDLGQDSEMWRDSGVRGLGI